MSILNWVYMKLFFAINRHTTENADKIVHISKYARDEYYRQRGYIRVKNKYYNKKNLINAGFFVENGILRHKGELKL